MEGSRIREKIKRELITKKNFDAKMKNVENLIRQKMFLHAIFKSNLTVATFIEVQRDNLIENTGANKLKHFFLPYLSVLAKKSTDNLFEENDSY